MSKTYHTRVQIYNCTNRNLHIFDVKGNWKGFDGQSKQWQFIEKIPAHSPQPISFRCELSEVAVNYDTYKTYSRLELTVEFDKLQDELEELFILKYNQAYALNQLAAKTGKRLYESGLQYESVKGKSRSACCQSVVQLNVPSQRSYKGTCILIIYDGQDEQKYGPKGNFQKNLRQQYKPIQTNFQKEKEIQIKKIIQTKSTIMNPPEKQYPSNHGCPKCGSSRSDNYRHDTVYICRDCSYRDDHWVQNKNVETGFSKNLKYEYKPANIPVVKPMMRICPNCGSTRPDNYRHDSLFICRNCHTQWHGDRQYSIKKDLSRR